MSMGKTDEDLRAELAEVEHLCRTLDPRARAYVGRLLTEVERLRTMQAEAERLRCERDDAERRAAMACEAADPLCPCDGCKLAAETGAPEGEQPAQADLDEAAAAQRDGQYATAYGGATLAEAAKLEGLGEREQS